MRKWVVAMAVACLAAGEARADGSPTQGAVSPSYLGDWVKALGHIQGRLLAGLIRRGMTDAEVVRLLGKGDKPLPSAGLAGGQLFMRRDYLDYGLAVLLCDDDGVMRVDSVAIESLFD